MIVLRDGRGIANDGQPYENSYAWFMKMQEGQVIDGKRWERTSIDPRIRRSGAAER